MKIIPLATVAQSAIFEFQAVNGSIQVETQSKTFVQVSMTVPCPDPKPVFLEIRYYERWHAQVQKVALGTYSEIIFEPTNDHIELIVVHTVPRKV